MISHAGDISLQELMDLNVAVPRYTSYPTANLWNEGNKKLYSSELLLLKEQRKAVSLYIHIPFCKSMCLYCGCSVILNRRVDRQQQYVDYLIREIHQLASALDYKPLITQLHFGGGTPTCLTPEQFTAIFEVVKEHFILDLSQEISIEIDPRTVSEDEGKKLTFLRDLGFNRVSFGIQDSNSQVQEAVKRRQSWQMSKQTFFWAKELGFQEINLDLIYGLPLQTVSTFKQTCEDILSLKPDRIALFSYAKIPWLKAHQKAIKDEDLPEIEEKFMIYLNAREVFKEHGYAAIGMDHFALENSPLAKAYRQKTLQRNFQGYFLKASPDLIGLGVTSIGEVNGHFFQNEKDLDKYYSEIDSNQLPINRVCILNEDDKVRKWVIASLMCRFELDKEQFEAFFCFNFDSYFHREMKLLEDFQKRKMVFIESKKISVSKKGELFIRNIASCFDRYYQKNKKKQSSFSKAV